ncbi:MAG: endonuclease/exonuclease/phosphatase family protein [Chitinophagaceae bacterium]|nr:endonuclease/exonuclease/phosphatase family protein [Chitinophagaceae bacterium]MBK9938951.1 endonuclease/exonuclease/phosphatase family protein [Chitinophagaceae bacterium]
MSSRLRLFTKRFFIYTNIVVVAVFLLACLVPYLNPQSWWFISFLGLSFPFLLLIVIAFAMGWLIILKPRLALISVIALLLGFKSIGVFLAFHKKNSFVYKKETGTIRVVSWNVARFIELKRNTNKGSETRLKMFDLIKQQNADILCLQEFHTSTDSAYYDNIKPIQQELGYPYYYFSFDNDGDRHYYSSIIFSRYPIIDTGKIRYPRPTLPDVLLHTDIKVNNDTVRVFATHLQSLQFGHKDYERIDKISNARDSLLANSRNILSKLKKGFTYRSIQADLAHKIIKDSPHPVLLCADLNDVPNSYTYFTVRGKMQDAFLKKGFGIGRTFAALSPTLRIDYIFADSHFSIKQFTRIVKNYSDHYMLVADVQLKK